MRYMIQYMFNGVVRQRLFRTPQEAGRFGYNIQNIGGVTEVTRVIEVA